MLSGTMRDLVDLNYKYAEQRSSYYAEYKLFLQSLFQWQIDYVGVDVPRVSADFKDYLSDEGMARRDKRMSKAYLCENRSNFSFIGANHAKGMQEHIIKYLPKDQASSHFYFVHIYKEAPLSEQEVSLRAGERDHPLGLHIYNANEMSEDEIVDTILQQIRALAHQAPPKYEVLQTQSKPQNKKVRSYEALFWQKKHRLVQDIETKFGDQGVYQSSLIAKLDLEGEKYRQELMDFIAKPQPYDVISFFRPIFSESKFQALTKELVATYKRKPPLDLNNIPLINFNSLFEEKKETEVFNPGYNWKQNP